MNNIIILSQESDHSTSIIIRWINFFGYKNVIRINTDDPNFRIICIYSDKLKIQTSWGSYQVLKMDLVWFRRSPSTKIHLVDVNKYINDFDYNFKVFKNLEGDSIMESFYNWILNNCRTIANPFKSSSSKIDTLIIADRFGVNVPEWIICDSKNELKLFASNKENIVQKTFNHYNFTDKETKETLFLFTKLVENIDLYQENFDSSFFQEYIDKKYEIRTFFWNNQFYSMAIFSQDDSQTKVDFRNYNRKNPNRNIPVTLSEDYSNKLKKMINFLGFDTCSIDILVTKENKYVFLEINPIGQFGMVSYPCNYNIEKIIAEDLIKILTNEKR